MRRSRVSRSSICDCCRSMIACCSRIASIIGAIRFGYSTDLYPVVGSVCTRSGNTRSTSWAMIPISDRPSDFQRKLYQWSERIRLSAPSRIWNPVLSLSSEDVRNDVALIFPDTSSFSLGVVTPIPTPVPVSNI